MVAADETCCSNRLAEIVIGAFNMVAVGLLGRHCEIVDLPSDKYQKIDSSCGCYTLLFHGEVYNFVELRSRSILAVRSSGCLEKVQAEALLQLIDVWGVERTLQSLVGVFSLAFLDREKNLLTLARDHMGGKPLYWGWQSDVLLFGTELKDFKAHPEFKGEINRSALTLLLRHNYIPAPYSIYQGIHKLPAGHFISIPLGKGALDIWPKPYWSMREVIERGLQNPWSGSDEEAVDALERQLMETIGEQMQAGVLPGGFLSGGVDSSTVVALMQKHSRQSVRTFAVGFNEPGYDEAEHAKAVAQHLGTDHTELYVSAADALAVIPKLPLIYGEPFADSSQIPTYLVSRMAREHVAVALSGDAGDELFGGYNTYQFGPRVWEAISKLPLALRTTAAAILGTGLPLPQKLGKLAEVLPARSREDFYLLLSSHWRQPGAVVRGAAEPPTILSSPDAWPITDSFTQWMMAVDAQQYMVDDCLVKVERAAAANDLQVRVPMLDHRVVEFAWRLPLSLKIRDGKGKWVLREVLYRYVPKELIERPKKGFSIPLASWLRGPLRDWAESLLDEARLQQEGYFNPKPIRRAWQQHLTAGKDNSSRLWSVLMFQAWLDAQRG